MSDPLPAEAEKLLAVAPDEFVAERQRIARDLRAAGRSDEAAAVARLRKPPPVVLAVNRAARARPKAARAAADAALRVQKTQLGGDSDAYREALAELEASLELLSDVALAHVVPAGKRPSETTRRRVRDLLRNAIADDEARKKLAGGVLDSEIETAGFGSLAGIVPARSGQRRVPSRASEDRRQNDKPRRERERELRSELAEAEKRLEESERSLKDAERERAKAERAVASLRTKLERL